jgi:heme exporter protein D
MKLVFVAVGVISAALVVYARSLTTDFDIQRFNASATALAAVAGILAFVVLVVYTKETYKLRTVAQQQVREAQIQNETAIRPILGFDISERQQVVWAGLETSNETTQTVNDAFVMRNLGLGPAFNIQTKCDFDDIRLDIGSTILGQGQTVPVDVVAFPETPDQRTFDAVFRVLPIYQSGKLPERIEITLTCESTNRTRHETRFSLVYNPETDALWIEFLAAK